MEPKLMIAQVKDCWIILWSNGSIGLVFRPGEPPHWVIWGNHPPPELTRALNSALGLMEAGIKDPAIHEQCAALADRLISDHEPELRKYLESRAAAQK